MRTGRPKQPVILDPADKEKLELLARRPKTAQRAALRSKIVLRAAEGMASQEIAGRLGVTGATVGKWRERYRLYGMKGLSDDPRPGTPRNNHGCKGGGGSDADAGKCAPDGYSLEHTLTGAESGAEPERCGANMALFRITTAPQRKTFKLSTDPLLVEKVRDIVGLYLNPPEHAIVLCVDEKSQVQALNRTQPILPLRPGRGDGAPTF